MHSFYKGKTVLVTGHMGFKGTWLCKCLVVLGAEVVGYGLDNDVTPSIFKLSRLEEEIVSIEGDVRDLLHMKQIFSRYQPEIVFHMAAQPIVLIGYEDPVTTYETNVMGTVNLMECVRHTSSVRSVINITTDKVYENNEEQIAFVETDRLNGKDPYSNSKSCSELVTQCYVNSFFEDREVRISTVRAGNVIGGGDFSPNRVVPDCVRAALEGKSIEIRNPNAIRPFQHVLEALNVYLQIAKKQYEDDSYVGHYNVGPDESGCLTAGELATLFCDKWGEDLSWHSVQKVGPKEAGFLTLNCDKLKKALGWRPIWTMDETMDMIVEYSKAYQKGQDVSLIMDEQIKKML